MVRELEARGWDRKLEGGSLNSGCMLAQDWELIVLLLYKVPDPVSGTESPVDTKQK